MFSSNQLERIGIDFLRRIHVNSNTQCWEWRGSKLSTGYGQIFVIGKGNKRVHRVSAHLFLGFDLDSIDYICHTCDNKICCNPDHLFIGDNSENQLDAVSKGRHSKARFTHCSNGHEYTEETIIWEYGLNPNNREYKSRRCKICQDNKNNARNFSGRN